MNDYTHTSSDDDQLLANHFSPFTPLGFKILIVNNLH